MGDFSTSLIKLKGLSIEDRFEVVDKLLACPCISDKDSRQTVLGMLNDEFSGIIDAIHRRTDNRSDVIEIVSTCLKRPGSLDTLVEIVALFDNEKSIPVQNLRKVMQDIFFEALVFSQELFDELIEITTGLPITRDQLQWMYLRSIPRGWPFLDFVNSDVDEPLPHVIQNLAQARSQTDGTLPLIEFVKLLGSVSELSLQEKLRAWITKAAKYAGVADIDVVFPKQNVPAEQSEKTFSYLLVKIKPDCFSENKFSVRAWFLEKYKSDTYKQNYETLSTSNEGYTFNMLEQMLNKLVSLCIGKINAISSDGNMKDLMVEIFLPFAYLNYPDRDIHCWMVDRGFGNRKAISNAWPLVVRSLERVEDNERVSPNVQFQWKRNWDRLKQRGIIAEPLFLNREYFEKTISLDGKKCLAFTVVPPAIKDVDQVPDGHIFTQMASEGTTIALWPRSDIGLDETKMEEAYMTILSGCHFSELPSSIWKKREEGDPLLNHLTLFWDDPRRVPPDDEGTAPETD